MRQDKIVLATWYYRSLLEYIYLSSYLSSYE
jgi:hypothetical protein